MTAGFLTGGRRIRVSRRANRGCLRRRNRRNCCHFKPASTSGNPKPGFPLSHRPECLRRKEKNGRLHNTLDTPVKGSLRRAKTAPLTPPRPSNKSYGEESEGKE